MTRTTITEEYILVETDDIDFSMLRLAVEQLNLLQNSENYDIIEITKLEEL